MRRGTVLVKGVPIGLNRSVRAADRTAMNPTHLLAGALLAVAPLSAPHPETSPASVADVQGRLTPATLRLDPASAQDSVSVGVCEGGLSPIGVILPPGGAGTDCGTPLVLRHGWKDGDPGTYVFLDLPVCLESWCRDLPTADRLRCEILIGNPCCWIQNGVTSELRSLAGTRMGPVSDALQGRFDADTDRREGICHERYQGNSARVLQILIVEPASKRGWSVYRVIGSGRFFLRERQGTSDDLVGELMLPATSGGN